MDGDHNGEDGTRRRGLARKGGADAELRGERQKPQRSLGFMKIPGRRSRSMEREEQEQKRQNRSRYSVKPEVQWVEKGDTLRPYQHR